MKQKRSLSGAQIDWYDAFFCVISPEENGDKGETVSLRSSLNAVTNLDLRLNVGHIQHNNKTNKLKCATSFL